MAYILHENRMPGEPGREYLSTVENGYDAWGIDSAVLKKAPADSIGRKAADGWPKSYRQGAEKTSRRSISSKVSTFMRMPVRSCGAGK